VAFEFLLAQSQGCLIGLNFMEAPANFSQFLSNHAAMLVKFHGVVRHDRLPSMLARGKIPPRRYRLDTGVFPGALTSSWGGPAVYARSELRKGSFSA